MSQEHLPLDPAARADDPREDELRHDETHEVSPDVAYKRLLFVNVAFVGPTGAGDREWFLVDAGVTKMSEGPIASAAEQRFGSSSRPMAILLTHGHFDHVGAVQELSERWDCPVFAHETELPYLNGTQSYPNPDPSVGGGLTARLSGLFPRGPVDVSAQLQALPPDGSVPGLPGWRWIFTPGHTDGHVAFWREADGVLIAGDAFVTTNQESAFAAVLQEPVLQGPPAYFTTDWIAAEKSVQALAALEPEIVVTGHGRAMRGPAMRQALQTLAANFSSLAVPDRGRYVPGE